MTLAATLVGHPAGNLRQEYQLHQSLYAAQPGFLQHFLDLQAQVIAQAILEDAARVRFLLPDRVFPIGGRQALGVPAGQREQAVGRWLPFGRSDLRAGILSLFLGLERSLVQPLSLCGSLLRFTVARTMIYQMLPDGRPVRYHPLEGDEIPCQPVEDARMQPTYEDDLTREQVPYTPDALQFFLPQWVAFDKEDHLLTNTLEEAGARIASMQAFLHVLHHAVTIDPYFVADEVYQRKRAGILGQLVNQGRALARYEASEVIQRIKHRAGEGSLNRGLSLSLSYFDDQALTMEMYDMQVIPAGRIMFIPAFVVLAVRNEYARIAQDTRLNSSTRKHLISLLAIVETAFLTQKEYKNP